MNVGRLSVVIKTGGKQPARIGLPTGLVFLLGIVALSTGAWGVREAAHIHSHYVLSWRSPVRIRFQSPLVIAQRIENDGPKETPRNPRSSLTAYQQYACQKFGPACRVALAIQRSENPQGTCEVYHYNRDGTLDWGYFQINTIHLKRRGVNLRDLLDCKANIDFAYELYRENEGFTPWSVYNSGRYRRFLRE
ncbi:MAG: hypothetical protein ACJ74Z_18060 [Bryobacteraceae bacterium]